MRHGQTAQALFQHGGRLARGQRFHIGVNLRHEDIKQRVERRLRPVDRVILPFLEQMQIRMSHQFAEEPRLVDGDDQIQRRHDNGELAERAVRAVRAFRPAHPDLVAVAHAVVVDIRRVRVRRPRVHPLGGRVVHKGLAQQAHAAQDGRFAGLVRFRYSFIRRRLSSVVVNMPMPPRQVPSAPRRHMTFCASMPIKSNRFFAR